MELCVINEFIPCYPFYQLHVGLHRLEDEDWRVLFSYQQDSDITGHILYKCVYTSLQRSVKLKFNYVLCRYPDVPSKYMP